MPIYQIGFQNSEDDKKYAFLKDGKLDFEELSTYIQFQIVIQDKKKEGTKTYVADFKKCEKEDFIYNGMIEQEIPPHFEQYICPNSVNLGYKYKVRNRYEMQDDRTRLSY